MKPDSAPGCPGGTTRARGDLGLGAQGGAEGRAPGIGETSMKDLRC